MCARVNDGEKVICYFCELHHKADNIHYYIDGLDECYVCPLCWEEYILYRKGGEQ